MSTTQTSTNTKGTTPPPQKKMKAGKGKKNVVTGAPVKLAKLMGEGAAAAGQRGAGKRVKEFKGPSGKTYDLALKGFGMLSVVACEFKKDIARDEAGDEVLRAIGQLLAARDKQCGKPPKTDYRSKAQSYVAEVRKHLSGKCKCALIDVKLLDRPPLVK